MSRRPIDSLGDGPAFDADSISLPPEARAEMGKRAPPPKKAPRPSIVPVIVGAIVLGIVGGAAIFFVTDDSQPSVVAIEPVLLEPEPQPSADPVPTKVAAVPVKRPAAVAKPPLVAKPPPKVANATPKPAPKPKPEAKPAEKSVRVPKKAAKAPSAARLDDAFAKLENLGADRPSPAEPAAGNNAIKDEGVSKADQPSASLEASCASGTSKACVAAGEKAEQSTDPEGGSKARQMYGVACTQGEAEGCWRLARLFERGVGGSRNAAQAKALRNKACELGHRGSCASVSATTSH